MSVCIGCPVKCGAACGQAADGVGGDLTVYDTDLGRVGALCCWEHLQPLSKYAMYAQNEQVHIAAWPSFSLYRGGAYALGAEVNNAASRIYAVEGQCFVLAPCATVSAEMIQLLCGDDPMKRQLLLEGGGFTGIYAPDGQLISEVLPEGQEGIVYADLDLGMISLAKAAADPAGHYSRLTGFAYTRQALELQRRFDTEALAAAELQVIVHDTLSPSDRAIVSQMEMFWLASVDPQGSPTVSFKSGAPGFVRMPDDKTLLFPCFDGNGMFFSMGNIASTSHVRLLFMDFVTPSRLRVQGDAQLTDDPAIVGQWPGARFAVKVGITALITNCPGATRTRPTPWAA